MDEPKPLAVGWWDALALAAIIAMAAWVWILSPGPAGGQDLPTPTKPPASSTATFDPPPITTGQPAPPPRGRFRPGQESTGRLDLVLVRHPDGRVECTAGGERVELPAPPRRRRR